MFTKINEQAVRSLNKHSGCWVLLCLDFKYASGSHIFSWYLWVKWTIKKLVGSQYQTQNNRIASCSVSFLDSLVVYYFLFFFVMKKLLWLKRDLLDGLTKFLRWCFLAIKHVIVPSLTNREKAGSCVIMANKEWNIISCVLWLFDVIIWQKV